MWYFQEDKMKIKNILNLIFNKKNKNKSLLDYLTDTVNNFKWTREEKKVFNKFLIEYVTETINNNIASEINDKFCSYVLLLFPQNSKSIIEKLQAYSPQYIIHFIKSVFENLHHNYNNKEVIQIFILLAQYNYSRILNISIKKPITKFSKELWAVLFDLYANYGLDYFESQLELLSSEKMLLIYKKYKTNFEFNFKKLIFDTIELNKHQFVKKFHFKYIDIISSDEYKSFISHNISWKLKLRNIIFDLMLSGNYSDNILITLRFLNKHYNYELFNFLISNPYITYNIVLYSLIPECKKILNLLLSLLIKLKNKNYIISVFEFLDNGFSLEEKENYLQILLNEEIHNMLFNYGEISEILFAVQKNIYLNKEIYYTDDIIKILDFINKIKDKNNFSNKLQKGLLIFLNEFIKTVAIDTDTQRVLCLKDNTVYEQFNPIRKYRHFIHAVIDICYRFYHTNYNSTHENQESVAFIRNGFTPPKPNYENKIIKNVCAILSSNDYMHLDENIHLQFKIYEYLEKYIIHRCLRLSSFSEEIYNDKYNLIYELLIVSKQNFKNCDELFDNITNVIKDGNIEGYYDYIMEHVSYIKNLDLIQNFDLENLRKRFVSENYYSITFNEALKYINMITIKLIGNLTVLEGDSAKTTGNIIYLPSKIDYFKDLKNPISKNRNLSYYIALTIHEISHIIGGTFSVNPFKYLRNNFKYFRLAADIHNIIEDYRCEKYFKEIHPEEEYKLLLENLNRHFLSKSINITDPLKLFLFDLCNYFNNQNHLNEFYTNDKIELTEFINTETKSAKCREKNLNTYKEIVEWFYTLISKMKISNPVASLKFVDLFYKIYLMNL